MPTANRSRRLLAALALTAAPLPALAGAPMEGPERFVVVDYRIASGVAATLEAQQAAMELAERSRPVFIGQTFEWLDGRTCDLWALEDGTGPDPIAADPVLADLQTGLGGDAPGFVPVTVTCRDAPFVDYVQVDARVIIAFVPNGTLYLVIERAMDEAEAMAVQQALADRGLYAGPIDGVVDAEVRAAVADVISAQGGPPSAAGILTQAVVDALLGA
jgi:hypothetical protein